MKANPKDCRRTRIAPTGSALARRLALALVPFLLLAGAAAADADDPTADADDADEAAVAAPRPNIVLIFTDDQGVGDVGCYGSAIPTPHIDSLARDGLRFTQFYSASSICTPSRFGLLTGRNPVRSQDRLLGALMFLGGRDRDRGIRPGETTLATVLGGAGYATALVGKWHLGHGAPEFLPTRHGFDYFRGHTGGCIDYFTMTYGIRPDWYRGEEHDQEDGYATDLITDEAVRYLGARARAGAGAGAKAEPFFLYLAYNAPHFGKGWSPAAGRPVNLMQARGTDLRRPGVRGIPDKVRREFAAMTVALDDGVGRVLQALDDHGLAEDTLAIFLTDHGGDPTYGGSNQPFRGDKATLFEGGLRVPCLLRWPDVIRAGAEVDAPCSSLDLFPTLCGLAGVDPAPHRPDGRDLGGLLRGGPPPPDPVLYWETGVHDELGRGAWSALRLGRWKLVETPAGGRHLFDLHEDPIERVNRAASHPAEFARLLARRTALAAEMRK